MKFQVFPENADIAPSKRVKFGIDPTFPRLHLGHLVPLRLVKKMMVEGHQITIVLGTFTAQLGDPSGRDNTRPILTEKEVEENAIAIFKTVEKLLGKMRHKVMPDDRPPWSVFLNGALHNHLRLPEFLRQCAQFTLAHMTSRNAFAKRIEDGNSIAIHELLVPICQGWDSLELKTEIEIGGQDQLFNFQVARQLQEQNGQKPQACILMPIINGTDGRKMSKSLGNCIFLDEDPHEMFGKVMSIPDTVMEEWFPLLVDFTTDDKIHPMDKKKILAVEIVTQLHCLADAITANERFVNTFQKKEVPDDIIEISASNVLEAMQAIAVMSKTALRQLLKEGAVKVDGEKVFEEKSPVKPGQTIQIGRRMFGKVKNV